MFRARDSRTLSAKLSGLDIFHVRSYPHCNQRSAAHEEMGSFSWPAFWAGSPPPESPARPRTTSRALAAPSIAYRSGPTRRVRVRGKRSWWRCMAISRAAEVRTTSHPSRGYPAAILLDMDPVTLALVLFPTGVAPPLIHSHAIPPMQSSRRAVQSARSLCASAQFHRQDNGAATSRSPNGTIPVLS